VRFSFTAGPDLQSVATVEPGENGVTMVDVYAWLTDVEPMQKDGEPFLGISAFELHLAIDGAEAFIIEQNYPQDVRQVGKQPGDCIVGLWPGLYFEEGAMQLVHWKVMFQGRPENVVFRLDPEAMVTCERTPGCEGTGISALYTGIDSQGFLWAVLGAGYQPAYLNYVGEPDLAPVRGNLPWRQAGKLDPVADR
jgi:hypothetical protein